jgi:small subunit ribosomal protein S4
MEKRPFAPGQHGQGRKKLSEYGVQLRAKQSVRRIYGVLERPFRNYFKEADRLKGITGENLLVLLERRLDNVVYRLGLASSRAEARQLVRHGHFRLNGHKMNIPSYLVTVGDEISVRDKSKDSVKFKDLSENTSIPEWLSSNIKELSGRVEAMPSRESITIPVDEQLIVELYSR